MRADSLRSLGVGTDTGEKFRPPAGSPPKEPTDLGGGRGRRRRGDQGPATLDALRGSSLSNGGEFDASWDRGEPVEFTLGAGEVISGWDLAYSGMFPCFRFGLATRLVCSVASA